VLKDIADEERVHVGEFMRLLYELAPDEKKFYTEGADEVEVIISKLKKKNQKKNLQHIPAISGSIKLTI
jgi:rubrerythrin